MQVFFVCVAPVPHFTLLSLVFLLLYHVLAERGHNFLVNPPSFLDRLAQANSLQASIIFDTISPFFYKSTLFIFYFTHFTTSFFILLQFYFTQAIAGKISTCKLPCYGECWWDTLAEHLILVPYISLQNILLIGDRWILCILIIEPQIYIFSVNIQTNKCKAFFLS